MAELTKKAGWVTAGDILYKGLGFLISIYLARSLGAMHYGWFLIGISILGYCNRFSDFGLLTLGTREAAKPQKKRSYPLSSIFNLRVALALVAMAVGLLALFVINPASPQKWLYAIFILSTLPHALTLDWIFSGKQQFRDLTTAHLLQHLSYGALLLVLVFTPEDVTWAALSYGSGVLLSALFAFWKLWGSESLSFRIPGRRPASALLRRSSMIGMAELSTSLVVMLPPLAIGFFIGSVGTGQFGVAWKLALTAMLIDRVFTALFFPILTQQFTDKPSEGLSAVISSIVRIMGFVGIMAALALHLFADPLVAFLFGAEYTASVTLLSTLSWFVAFSLIHSIFGYGLLAIGEDDAYLRSAVIGGMFSLVLILWSSAQGRLDFVAWSLVAGEAVFIILRYREFNRKISVQAGTPLILAIVVILLITFISRIHGVGTQFLAIVGLVALPVLYLVTGGLRMDDLRWFRHQLQK